MCQMQQNSRPKYDKIEFGVANTIFARTELHKVAPLTAPLRLIVCYIRCISNKPFCNYD